MRKKIILASGSPRRKEILKLMGIPFTVRISNADEDSSIKNPQKQVLKNAAAKAGVVAGRLKSGIVLGGDTVVVYRDRILGKPETRSEARQMLTMLSGRTHRVMTGLCLVNVATGKKVKGVEITRVRFRKLEKREIDRYVRTGEPMDKAGAYGIQKKGCVLVRDIEGCYFNVVGLPVARLMSLLKKIGYNY